jgi:hypothetical protein
MFDLTFKEFLSTFSLHHVRFLVVGGHALAVHGRPRYTDDLDVWVEPTRANAKRVVKALVAFGYESYAAAETEFCSLDRMTHLGVPPLRIDVMTSVSGVLFGDAWSHRFEVVIDGMTLAFISRDDLIKNKAASGRAKDLADIAMLEELTPALARSIRRHRAKPPRLSKTKKPARKKR